MARAARIAPGGFIYHVLNRGVRQAKLFRSRKDHLAFQSCLVEALEKTPIRLLGYCVMPDHWHLLLWPSREGELARFMMWLTNTHVRRWLTAHGQVGAGHLYQGRFKSFAIQDDGHLQTVDRYIARNAVRAKLVDRAERWPWSSVGQALLPLEMQAPLAAMPVVRRRGWLEWVNQPQTAAEEAAIQRCIRQNRPFGDDQWLKTTMGRLGWREPGQPGRPRNKRRAK